MGHQTDVPMTAPSNFERLVMVFLRIKNGSNLERSLLSTIQSYDANGRKSKNFLIMLLYSYRVIHIFWVDSKPFCEASDHVKHLIKKPFTLIDKILDVLHGLRPHKKGLESTQKIWITLYVLC